MGYRYPRTVYAIQHKPTGRIYVGSTNDLDARLKAHMGALKAGKHPNKLMQEDYNLHGGDYEVFVLDEYDSYETRSTEHEWMEELNTGDERIGYNSRDPHFTRKSIDIPEITPGVPTPNSLDQVEDD